MVEIFIVSNNIPIRATAGSAGYDICSAENVIIPGRRRTTVATGIHIQMPSNYEAQVRSRSGLAHKYGICVLNAPGTIDSDYTGEIKVILYNTSDEDYTIKIGDRIAQLVFAKCEEVKFIRCDNLQETTRNGGFGSTGC